MTGTRHLDIVSYVSLIESHDLLENESKGRKAGLGAASPGFGSEKPRVVPFTLKKLQSSREFL